MTRTATMPSSVLGEPIRGPRARRSPNETKATRSVPGMPSEDAFGQFVARVRAGVDARLAPWLDARVSKARSRGADVEAVAGAVRDLVLRGGKRVRAVLL